MNIPLFATVFATLTCPFLVDARVVNDIAAIIREDGPAPVVFIPGKGGSQLEVRVDPDHRGPCPLQTEWTRVWINIYDFLPFTGQVDCWAANMELEYNMTSGRSHYSAGREFRIPGWGNTNGIEYIDPSWLAYLMGNVGAYAASLVKELTGTWGYKRGLDLVGAPYDFRFSPVSQEVYFEQLKSLIENTWQNNCRKRVVLVTHSMGGLMATYFLNHQSDQWKKFYIKALVTLNTPWEGAMVVAQLHAAGDDWGMEIVDRNIIRDQQRSYESAFFLLPHDHSGQSDEVIVETPVKNFTQTDYEELFDLLDHPEGRAVLSRVRPAWDSIQHPGVDFYCWYGKGVPTVAKVVYDEASWPHGIPSTPMGDGDGTVHLSSLEGCGKFSHPEAKTELRAFDGVNHLNLLHDSRAVKRLAAILRDEAMEV